MAEKKFEPIDEEAVKQQVADALLKGSVLEIHTEEDWIKARTLRREVALAEKKADKHFTVLKEPHNKARAAILEREHEITDPIERFYDAVDDKIVAFEEHDASSRIALQRRLQDQARKTAEEEREAQALELEKEGEFEKAGALRAGPLYVPAISIPEFDNFLPGESRGESWSIDVEGSNLQELVLAVAAGEYPLTCLQFNGPVLTAMGKAMKQTFNVKGVKLIRRTTIIQKA